MSGSRRLRLLRERRAWVSVEEQADGGRSSRLSYNTDISNADRATINMIHNNTALTISQDVRLPWNPSSLRAAGLTVAQEASRVEEEAKRRLLKSRKLSLVVDLDQTIIHATVDPTVAEWQQDKNNPNHDAVKSVRAFKLVDDGPGARGCWYYIKLRPGLQEFLENISKLYELHIYTMGTRAYAQHIANIVDPDRKIFGDRILSRDESGSLTAKSLQRLFPVDTKMVVIIDDRGDVWQWSDNLIKVAAYDFFVGIGDINSSFLPRRPEVQQGPKTLRLTMPKPKGGTSEGDATVREEPKTTDPSDDQSQPKDNLPRPMSPAANDVSTLERLVSMSGGDDPTVLQQQTSRQDEALAAQLEDRPLLQKQKLLDAEDEAAVAAAESKDDEKHDEPPAEPSRPRPNLLHDDDTELQHLERSLRDVHRAFFEEYDRKLTKARGGRLAELRGGKNVRKLPVRDDEAVLEVVPDVKNIMPQMKMRVLDGVILVFSGVLPLGTDIQRYSLGHTVIRGRKFVTNDASRADIALWAKSFGAQVSERIGRRTTHVIAARNRTNKVRQAARRPHIKIVSTHWLLDSISQWQWLDEEPYLTPVAPEDREPPSSGSALRDSLHQHPDDGEILSSSDEDTAPLSDEDMDRGDVEEVDDPEGVRPADLEENHSPIDGFENYDWRKIDSELAEFLGSDGEESDNGSVASDSSQQSRSGRKRKRSRSSTPSDAGPGSASNDTEVPARSEGRSHSRLAKRQHMARQRTTGLKAVANAADNGSSLPTPDVTGEEEDDGESKDEDEPIPDAIDDDDDDEWERELKAEMEREMMNADNDGG